MPDNLLAAVVDAHTRARRFKDTRPYRVGDLAWYLIIPPGRAGVVYAASVVVRGMRRGLLGIATVLDRRVRYVSPARLSRLPPPADVQVYWSEQCCPPMGPDHGAPA